MLGVLCDKKNNRIEICFCDSTSVNFFQTSIRANRTIIFFCYPQIQQVPNDLLIRLGFSCENAGTLAEPCVVQTRICQHIYLSCSLFLFLQGGTVCCFDFEQTLPSHVQSGSAFFGNLATVKVERLGNSLVGRRIPGMSEKIILQSKQG